MPGGGHGDGTASVPPPPPPLPVRVPASAARGLPGPRGPGARPSAPGAGDTPVLPRSGARDTPVALRVPPVPLPGTPRSRSSPFLPPRPARPGVQDSPVSVSIPPAPATGAPRCRCSGSPGVQGAPVPARIAPSRGRAGTAARSLLRYAEPPGPGSKDPRSGMRSRWHPARWGAQDPPRSRCPTRGLNAALPVR